MIRRTTHIWSLSVALLLPLGLWAQGNTCGTATLVGCGATVNGTTVGATVDVAPFCGTGDGTGGGVWFRFIGTGTQVTASLCGSAYDTKIRVYTGACTGLACVVGNDDFCGLQSQVTWMGINGTTYHILVHGYMAAQGNYTLNITCAAPPVPMCYDYTTTPYLAEPHLGTSLFLTDDVHSGIIPIGFTFCYNGGNYTQCVVSSNNYITFNTANANTYSSWVTQAIPTVNPASVMNAILSPWQDIHPGIGGSIRYQTVGVAPDRRFVVSYQNIPMFSCTSQLYSSQTVLYEGSNCIATLIGTKPVCPSWNNGLAVHGLNSTSGAGATVIPGRNNTQWTAFSEGRLFVPTCAPCSTATSEDCLSIVLPVEMAWFRGHAAGSDNLLEWATASEENTHFFSVERSANGEDFDSFAVVDAAGFSQGTLEYQTLDASPFPGVNYYRLRTVDIDGSMSLSHTISIERSVNGTISVWPNPASGLMNVSLPANVQLPAEVLIRDLQGRLVRTLRHISHDTPMTIAGLAAGSYLLEVPALGAGSSKIIMVE